MAGLTTYLSIITLNISGLNSPIKRHWLANWIKKQDLNICCLQEIHLAGKYLCRLRVKKYKKTFQAKPDNKQLPKSVKQRNGL
jgi:exonuclease III